MVRGGAMAPEEPEFDVVVAGSGAAGMTAALTVARHGLSVVVIEKTSYFGGSTARAGGGVSVPGHSVLMRAGGQYTPHLARTHLRHRAGSYLPAPDGMAITAADYRWLSLGTRHPRAIWTTAKVAGRMAKTKALRRRTISLGQALSAGLRAGLATAGVPVWLDTPLTGLLTSDGRVTGVRVNRDGQPAVILARRGVLIATGGFERNAAMRAEYQRQPIGTDWTVGSPGNTGDGIVAGAEAGAALDLMDDAWWGPSIPLTGGPFFCLAERSLPGCIMVNAAGQPV